MLLGGIVINEVLVDPSGASNFDTDGSGAANHTDEYIELYNTSGAAIDISGVELWDAGVGNWFTFPPGTILQSGAHAMVMSGVQPGGSLPTGAPDDLFFEAGRGTALINNGGDNIVVYDPAADEYIQAVFNGDSTDNPPASYAGFSATATLSGPVEDFGTDIDGYSIQRSPDGGDSFANDGVPTPGIGNICFTQGTLFSTPEGPRAIETLRPGELLLTKDHGAQEIRWIWARRRTAADIGANPTLQAVRVAKGALGGGLPRRDLLVSRQHRLLLASKIAMRVFGQSEVLAPAKDLTRVKGISLEPAKEAIVYYHILMQRHEILFAEGAPAESLYLGQQALASMEGAAIAELRQIFGPDWPGSDMPTQKPARVLAQGKKLKTLIQRHEKNNRQLVGVEG